MHVYQITNNQIFKTFCRSFLGLSIHYLENLILEFELPVDFIQNTTGNI